jgi:hypothetical protein
MTSWCLSSKGGRRSQSDQLGNYVGTITPNTGESGAARQLENKTSQDEHLGLSAKPPFAL